jgi:hypothetical protein
MRYVDEIRLQDTFSPCFLHARLFWMTRLARIVIAGLPHPVTQRGNRREALVLKTVGQTGRLPFIPSRLLQGPHT